MEGQRHVSESRSPYTFCPNGRRPVLVVAAPTASATSASSASTTIFRTTKAAITRIGMHQSVLKGRETTHIGGELRPKCRFNRLRIVA